MNPFRNEPYVPNSGIRFYGYQSSQHSSDAQHCYPASSLDIVDYPRGR